MIYKKPDRGKLESRDWYFLTRREDGEEAMWLAGWRNVITLTRRRINPSSDSRKWAPEDGADFPLEFHAQFILSHFAIGATTKKDRNSERALITSHPARIHPAVNLVMLIRSLGETKLPRQPFSYLYRKQIFPTPPSLPLLVDLQIILNVWNSSWKPQTEIWSTPWKKISRADGPSAVALWLRMIHEQGRMIR